MNKQAGDVLYTLIAAALLKQAYEDAPQDMSGGQEGFTPQPQADTQVGDPAYPHRDQMQSADHESRRDFDHLKQDTRNVKRELDRIQKLKPGIEQVRGILKNQQNVPPAPTAGPAPLGMAAPQSLRSSPMSTMPPPPRLPYGTPGTF